MDASDLARAQDPATPTEELERLAGHADKKVRTAVAANPNAPPDVLWALAVASPKVVLSNPGFALLSLEDPLWLQRPDPGKVHALMSYREAPAWFVDQVLTGPLALRCAIAARTRRPDVLWRLARESHASEKALRDTVFWNTAVPTSLRDHLQVEHDRLHVLEASSRRHPYALEAALESGFLQGDWYQGMSDFVSGLPARQLEHMAMSAAEPRRRAVASSPSTPPALLIRLARDPSLRVREAVARNRNCPQLLARALRRAELRRSRPAQKP